MYRRRPPALLCYLLAFSQIFWILGCQDSIRGGGSSYSTTLAGVLATQDLGSIVFDLYRDGVSAEPASSTRDARLAELDARRDPFVDAVNDIVNVNTLSNASQTAEALFTLVDDDTLPTLTEQVAKTLEQLISDPQALDAVVAILRSPRGQDSIPVEQFVGLLGRMFNYPETAQLWQASAQLIRDNDGVDDNGFPNGEPRLVNDLLALAQGSLQQASTQPPPSTSLSQAADEAFAALTEEATIRGTFDFGAPEWVVRLDDRGLPTVAKLPSGQVFPPFVDADQDGLADIDAQSRFVDAQGRLIDRPTFGDRNAPGFDAAGRALADTGDRLYVTVDAKKTILALFMQLGGELLSRDLHGKGRRVVEAGLGPQLPGGVYARENPISELQWGLLELLEDDVAPKMLRAISRQIANDPALAERIVVALSRGLNASSQAGQQSSFGTSGFSDPRVVQLVDDLLPLADDLFEQPASGQMSTARQLTETFAQLRTSAPNFAAQLAPLTKFVTVERETTADADRNDIDEARSWPVDFTQPSRIGSVDNRSALQQLLDLLARADGCTFFGNNLAVMIVNMMADLRPSTVGSLVSFLNALPGFLPNLFCSGISQDLASLDALARSGALDALLPVAKTFKDRGETPLLVRLLVRIQRDYEQTIRPIEPDLALFLDSGAMEAYVEVMDLSRSVLDPVSGESVADIASEAVSLLVDDDGVVIGPRGAAVRTRAHLLLEPLQELDRRVISAGLSQDLDGLSQGLFEVFLERVTVGGVEKLRNGSLIPLAERTLDIFARALPADAAVRKQDIDQTQADVLDFMASRDFATLVDVVRVIERSPSKALIDRGLVSLLTPRRTVSDDIFGAVAKISAILLQAPPSSSNLKDLAPFLATVLDPANPLVPGALKAFERLLTADQGQTILNVLRAALNPAPGEQHPPAVILIRVVQAVDDASGGPGSTSGGAPLSRSKLQSELQSVVDFIRDDVDGLGWVYGLIRTRQIR